MSCLLRVRQEHYNSLHGRWHSPSPQSRPSGRRGVQWKGTKDASLEEPLDWIVLRSHIFVFTMYRQPLSRITPNPLHKPKDSCAASIRVMLCMTMSRIALSSFYGIQTFLCNHGYSQPQVLTSTFRHTHHCRQAMTIGRVDLPGTIGSPWTRRH